MAGKKKLHDSCLKIFQFIRLLYEDKAYYDDVVAIFKDEINEQSANNIQVTLNKYINTLKIFGMKIVKRNKKYELLNGLYFMDFTNDDLKSLSLLITSITNFPEENVASSVQSVTKEIQMRMNGEDKIALNNLNSKSKYNLSFYFSNIKDQIKQCESLCKSNLQAEITYQLNGKNFHCICNPIEVIYDSKTAYLKAYDTTKRQNLEIPIGNIIELQESHGIVKPIEISTTVVYRLSGRLAKTYRLKENEYSEGNDNDGYYTIINKNEPYDKLIKRLMRYGANCEIISPKFIREQMLQYIKDSINNYN